MAITRYPSAAGTVVAAPFSYRQVHSWYPLGVGSGLDQYTVPDELTTMPSTSPVPPFGSSTVSRPSVHSRAW
jgi:hypothetical protein